MESAKPQQNRIALRPKYTTNEARLKTFKNWPIGLTQNKEDMANAGFIYSNFSDRVQCYFCEIQIEKWEVNDKPLEEHIKWSKNCNFVLMKIENDSKNFIIDKIRPIDIKDELDIENKIIKTKNNILETGLEYEIEKLRKQIKEYEKENINNYVTQGDGSCCVCYNKLPCVVFLPCRHMINCVECALSISKCPVCRTNIEYSFKIFLK